VKFGNVMHRTIGLLDLVHMDVWRSIKAALLGGHQYFISFIDNFYKHYWVYLMRQRFEL